MVGILIFSLIVLAVGAYCALKESKIAGFYKSVGLFGRVKAFIIFDCVFGGIAGMVFSVIGIINDGFSAAFPIIIATLIILAIGVLMYMLLMKRCAPEARAKVTIDLIIAGFGVTMKVSLFFLSFIINLWLLTAPKQMILEDGRTVFVDGEVVYDNNMKKIGTYDGHSDTVTIIRQY